MVMDLDNFKEINDNHGHHVGDRALCEIARVLRTTIRPYDICVRYAGDEFIVVMSGCGAEEAEQKRDELQRAIDAVFFEARPGKRLRIGVSIGTAVFPHDGDVVRSRCSRPPTAACIRTRPTASAGPREEDARRAALGGTPPPRRPATCQRSAPGFTLAMPPLSRTLDAIQLDTLLAPTIRVSSRSHAVIPSRRRPATHQSGSALAGAPFTLRGRRRPRSSGRARSAAMRVPYSIASPPPNRRRASTAARFPDQGRSRRAAGGTSSTRVAPGMRWASRVRSARSCSRAPPSERHFLVHRRRHGHRADSRDDPPGAARAPGRAACGSSTAPRPPTTSPTCRSSARWPQATTRPASGT